MAFRIALLAGPVVAVIGSALLLKSIDASPAVRVAVLGLVSVIGGGTMGVFGDKLPDLPSWLRVPRHGAHKS
jgi:hypothetical protein